MQRNTHLKLATKIQYLGSDPSACWEWPGADNGTGYCQVWFEDRARYVHRLSYEMFRGPIPAGLEIDHLCRNRRCVNPEHLEAVPRSVNVTRAMPFRRRAGLSGRKTHCPAGHPYAGDNLYVPPSGEYRCRECSRTKWRELYHRRKQSTVQGGTP